MLALAELEQLAERFRRDRARRKMTPRAAAVRDNLDRARRALAHAADVVREFGQHEMALLGAGAAEARELHELLESWAAQFGGAAREVDALGLNGRRRLLDYTVGSPKFSLVRRIADRLDELGVPLGGKDAGTLYDHSHEAMYLAGEDEPSRGCRLDGQELNDIALGRTWAKAPFISPSCTAIVPLVLGRASRDRGHEPPQTAATTWPMIKRAS